MHSFFSQLTDEDPGGLSDIVRSSGSGGATRTLLGVNDLQFMAKPVNPRDFDDPFHDPLLHELASVDPPDPMVSLVEMTVDGGDGKLQGEEMRRPCNTFSRVLRIAPDSAKSSPRTPEIKKRKDQMKKVICIPAPAAATGKTNGAVVPSDLWAWRKYGQKPIKGSPHPRGYYRCSSSKGCPARKQVERSRTDPNMLVITYTSEHNHPWPTQRNALAGSIRSQPARNNPSTSKNPPENQWPLLNMKEEHKETASLNTPLVKEEAVEMDKAVELSQLEDFFTCWGELEADPMDLHFTQEVLGDKSDEERENKALDPFSFFDWAGNSFGEAKGGL